MNGSCLCGAVAFEITREDPKLYQCHCTLCRKQSGTCSNAATIVKAAEFRFLRGEAEVTSWLKDSGFRSDFCSRCGSPVPNPLRDLDFVWIPAGLLEGAEALAVVSHIFTDDRVAWASPDPAAGEHPGFPGIEAHLRALD